MRLNFFFLIFALSAFPAEAASLQYLDSKGQSVSKILIGEPVSIRLTGLNPTLASTLLCGRGPEVSKATFAPSPMGVVDLSKVAPTSGTYEGVDPDGMWWSRAKGVADPIGSPEGPFTCNAEQGGRVIATAVLARSFLVEGVHSLDLTMSKAGIVGRFSFPGGKGPFPTVIIFGGSEGGTLAAWESDYFASKGYAALALAYFRADGLPPHLDRVPLEYFAKALTWLNAQPQVDFDRLGVIGTSRGGELSLLLASTFPVFKAVVSNVGSGLIWASGYLDSQDNRPTSSWTYQGKELPFLSFPEMSAPPMIQLPDGRQAIDSAAMFREALKNHQAQGPATIPVENIKAPILFLGGDSDDIWPSCTLGGMLFTHLKEIHHPYPDIFHCYKDAGHLIGLPGQPTTDLAIVHPVYQELIFFGGTPAGTAHAQRAGWSEVLGFFEKNLGGGR